MEKFETDIRDIKDGTDTLIQAFENMTESVYDFRKAFQCFIQAMHDCVVPFDTVMKQQSNNWRRLHGLPLRRKIRI